MHEAIKGVHGSGQVEYMPNPDSTRLGRVNKKWTRNRPGDLVGFFGSGLVGSVSGLSPGTKSSRIRRDLAKI